MDTALPHKFPFILNRNLAKANCTARKSGLDYYTCDIVVLGDNIIMRLTNLKGTLIVFLNKSSVLQKMQKFLLIKITLV